MNGGSYDLPDWWPHPKPYALMDCLEGMKDIPDNSVDLVLTDPPYYLPINSYVGTRKDGYNHRTMADASILRGYFKQLFSELGRILKTNGTTYVFCDGQSYPIFYDVMHPHHKRIRPLIWDKIVSYNGYTWRHQHEIIAWGERADTMRIPTGDGDILQCRGVLQEKRHHPAEKPVELLVKLITKHEPQNAIVLDPYAGSGSTLVACNRTGRIGLAFELDEQYEQTIQERMLEKIPRIESYFEQPTAPPLSEGAP